MRALRAWIFVLGGLLAAAGVTHAVSSSAPALRRAPVRRIRVAPRARRRGPNVVFVLTDDLSWDLVSQMPAVERMRREGATFTNFVVSDSLCCSSRATILTGALPHNTHVLGNVAPAGGYPAFAAHGDPLRSFALGLQRAGYRTGFFGKYLNQYAPLGDPVDPGWDRWWASSNGYRGYDYEVSDQGRPRFYGSRPRDFMTDKIARLGAAFVRSSARRRRPFFVELATYAPHRPYAAPRRYLGTAAALHLPRWSAFGRLVRNPPPWLGRRPPLTGAQRAALRTAWRKRVQSVQAVDDLITRVRRAAHRAGVLRDTYFVFSSDNGFHLGQHRLLAGKRTIFESDIRVPLIVTGPRVPPGSVVRRLAATDDLAPTFLAIAGRPRPPWADGRSLLRVLSGRAPRRWRWTTFLEHHHPMTALADPDYARWESGTPPSYRALRGRGWVYAEYKDGSNEFYDLRRDPAELDNIASRLTPAQRDGLHRILLAYARCKTGRACWAAARMRPPAGLTGQRRQPARAAA